VIVDRRGPPGGGGQPFRSSVNSLRTARTPGTR
jgi:hypothetical protein